MAEDNAACDIKTDGIRPQVEVCPVCNMWLWYFVLKVGDIVALATLERIKALVIRIQHEFERLQNFTKGYSYDCWNGSFNVCQKESGKNAESQMSCFWAPAFFIP